MGTGSIALNDRSARGLWANACSTPTHPKGRWRHATRRRTGAGTTAAAAARHPKLHPARRVLGHARQPTARSLSLLPTRAGSSAPSSESSLGGLQPLIACARLLAQRRPTAVRRQSGAGGSGAATAALDCRAPRLRCTASSPPSSQCVASRPSHPTPQNSRSPSASTRPLVVSLCTLTAALRAAVSVCGCGWGNQHAPPGSLFRSYWLARLRTQPAATPFDGEHEKTRDG